MLWTLQQQRIAGADCVLTWDLVFVASVVAICAFSAIILCRNEISQKRQATKETAARRRLERRRRSYEKHRLDERMRFKSNMSALDKLFEESSIDSQTRERYKKILQMGYKEKRQQAKTKSGLAEKLKAWKTIRFFLNEALGPQAHRIGVSKSEWRLTLDFFPSR